MKQEYLSYDALQLAAETSFILWIKEAESSHAEKWETWVAAHPEMISVVAEAKEVVLSNLEALQAIPHGIDTRALWDRIEENTEVRHAKVRSLRPLYIGLSIAAALALLFLIFPLSSAETQLNTSAGQHASYVLPDSSNIELNAGSTVRFQKKGFAQNREVYLKGEAYFEVEKGEGFVVKTDLGTVKVLGTSFNVFERTGSFEVQCLTGKVEVFANKGQRVILTPGKTAFLNQEGMLLEKDEDVIELATWRQGKFKYLDEPLADALEELKRQYDVVIDYRADNIMRECKCSFESDNLEKALFEILFINGLTYEIQGNTVIIKKETQ